MGWFPVNFCFLVPDEKAEEYEHQTGGVACWHPTIRGKIIEIPLIPSEERLLNKLFAKMDICSPEHVPYTRVVKRVISYLKLPVAAVESATEREPVESDMWDCGSEEISHEAWQWVIVNGGCNRCPSLEKLKGKRILMIYPNSD